MQCAGEYNADYHTQNHCHAGWPDNDREMEGQGADASNQPAYQWEIFECMVKRVLIMRHGHWQWNAREELDRGEQVLEFLFEQVVTYPFCFGSG